MKMQSKYKARCPACGKGMGHLNDDALVRMADGGLAHKECEDKPMLPKRPAKEPPNTSPIGRYARRRSLMNGWLGTR